MSKYLVEGVDGTHMIGGDGALVQFLNRTYIGPTKYLVNIVRICSDEITLCKRLPPEVFTQGLATYRVSTPVEVFRISSKNSRLLGFTCTISGVSGDRADVRVFSPVDELGLCMRPTTFRTFSRKNLYSLGFHPHITYSEVAIPVTMEDFKSNIKEYLENPNKSRKVKIVSKHTIDHFPRAIPLGPDPTLSDRPK